MASTRVTNFASKRAIALAQTRNPLVLVGGALTIAAAFALAMASGFLFGRSSGIDGRFGQAMSFDVAARALIAPELRKPRGVTVVPGSADKLYSDFRAIGYRLEDVMEGNKNVPRLYVKTLPSDLRQLRSVETRKAVFIKMMLPLILSVNEELRQTRARIIEITNRAREGGVLTAADQAWLNAQYERNDVKPGNIQVLLRKVDVVPPSLALAQAAEESGWGTSRFAREGRALFGQRTAATEGGLIPRAQGVDANIRVKTFDELLEGVRSYMRNLNTHNAYKGFRVVRAQLRRQAGDANSLNSLRLVEALEKYSERGQDYVDTIKTIIRVNNLRSLDDARLSETLPERLGA